MVLPIDGPQCFFIAILAFIVIGFQRGWRRELVSLVFALLASVLIRSNTSDAVGGFLGRIPAFFAFLTNSQPPATSTQPVSFLAGPMWSLIIFVGLVVLGYVVGNRAFPKPATPVERFIGIVPGVITGAVVLGYMTNYLRAEGAGSQRLTFNVPSPDPASYIPLIFVIAIVALVIALISARMRKASGKK